MPLFLAKISATFFQLLPNPLITIDQLNLLKYDNIKSENGFTNFDMGCPSKIFFEEGIKNYAYNWREGGKFSLENKISIVLGNGSTRIIGLFFFIKNLY